MSAPPPSPAATAALLVDRSSLRVREANPAACAALACPAAQLAALTLPELAPALPRAQLDAALVLLDGGATAHACLDTTLRRADGQLAPVRLTLLPQPGTGAGAVLVLAEDRNGHLAAAQALAQAHARLHAVEHHTPGLVYQFVEHADGRIGFPYLSEGCTALLGLTPAQLQAAPERFVQLLLPEDRPGYLAAQAASRAALAAWNWEGRIWSDRFGDVKWINLRATPRAVDGGAVLWDGIMNNITASKQEQAELLASRARLAELTEHIEQAKEQERTRIAREIHDDLGGNLTAIKMALAMLAARLPDDPALADKAAYLDDLVDRSIDAIHRIALDLRPPMLELGLAAALEWQAREFERQTGIACTLQAPARTLPLAPAATAALFRIGQEALTNIARHAGATRVRITLRRQRRQLQLAVADNGRGIGPADRDKAGSFGLRGMDERARALGGTLQLSDAAGAGTVVTVTIPLAAAGVSHAPARPDPTYE